MFKNANFIRRFLCESHVAARVTCSNTPRRSRKQQQRFLFVPLDQEPADATNRSRVETDDDQGSCLTHVPAPG